MDNATSPEVGFISSTQVKELARSKLPLAELVPAHVAARLAQVSG